MFSCKPFLCAVIVLSLTALSFSALADERFLDFYSLKPYSRGYVLKIRFNESVSYINRHTENNNKTIRINIRPSLIRFISLSSLHINEIIQAKKNNNVSLESIRLENIEHSSDPNIKNNQLVLTLDFKIPVTFNITQDSGSKIISIYLDQVGQSKKFQQQKLEAPDLSAEIINQYYAINLLSSRTPLTKKSVPHNRLYKKFKVYLAEHAIRNKHWYRLRLGYFSSWKKAKIALRKIKDAYPKAWVSKVDDPNIAKARKWLILDTLAAAKEDEAREKNKPHTTKVKPRTDRTNIPDKDFIHVGQSKNKKVQFLMQKGRNAMIDGLYHKAVSYYKKAYQLAHGDEKKRALEYLGLARERNNQIARARAIYRKYLKDYPKGESSERVKQRLEAILTARLEPRRRMARPKKRKSNEMRWETFGTLFQFYRYQVDDSDQTGKTNVDNSLSTNISVATRGRSDNYDMRFQFDGSHRYDALSRTKKSDARISSLYADIIAKRSGLHSRIGRQTSHNYGIQGRFDGILMDYPITNKYRTTVSYGYPVRNSRDNTISTETQFYGLGLDVTDIIQNWDAAFYAIKQTRNGISDREAIGTEIRTVTPSSSIFALLDYDTSYSELNTATMIANWVYGKRDVSTVNLILDYRKSPLLTTSNALIGQTITSFSDLAAAKTESELRGLARDRTATYKTITLSGSTPLSKKYRLNGDITISNLSGTPASASGSIAATQSTGNEIAYGLQFIGTNLLTDNDVSIIGVRIANRSTADTTTYDLNSRIILNKEWNIRPRFRYETQTQSTGINRTILKPSIRVDYRFKRNILFEFDTGYDFKRIDGSSNSKETSFYINLGYIYDF